MTSILLVILAVVSGAMIYLASRYVSLGANRAVNDLEDSIRKILDLSDPRLSLMVRQMWSNKFLQFRSEERSNEERSLELWLPKYGWSDGFYPWVVRKCLNEGLSRREFVDNAEHEYVVICFETDCAAAAEFAADTLVEMFGLRLDEKVKVRIDLHRSKDGRR